MNSPSPLSYTYTLLPSSTSPNSPPVPDSYITPRPNYPYPTDQSSAEEQDKKYSYQQQQQYQQSNQYHDPTNYTHQSTDNYYDQLPKRSSSQPQPEDSRDFNTYNKQITITVSHIYEYNLCRHYLLYYFILLSISIDSMH